MSRLPTNQENEYIAGELKEATSRREAAEDLLWTLLNTREFAYNH